MSNRFYVSILVILCVCMLGTPAAFSRDIKVGVVDALSGGAAAYGIRHLNGIELAVDEINAKGGVKGIGEKTALALLQEFGSIEKIYESIDKVEKARVKKLLETYKDDAFASKDLAILDVFACKDEDIKLCRIQPVNEDEAVKLFKELEFVRLIGKLKGIGTGLMNQTPTDQEETCRGGIHDAREEAINIEEYKKLIHAKKDIEVFFLQGNDEFEIYFKIKNDEKISVE